MAHSHVQKQKKEMAQKESMHHMHHSNVMHTRHGMDHEDHKMDQMEHEDKMQHSSRAMDTSISSAYLNDEDLDYRRQHQAEFIDKKMK